MNVLSSPHLTTTLPNVLISGLFSGSQIALLQQSWIRKHLASYFQLLKCKDGCIWQQNDTPGMFMSVTNNSFIVICKFSVWHYL